MKPEPAMTIPPELTASVRDDGAAEELDRATAIDRAAAHHATGGDELDSAAVNGAAEIEAARENLSWRRC